MKILFITKRHPQQRDLIERPYGRFHHLPVALATLGHEVRVLLCSHRRIQATTLERDGVIWSSHDVLALGPRRLVATLTQEAQAFRPDWTVGCSDAWYGWLAQRLAQHAGGRLAIDAYDNYEAYMRWNLPLHWKWRQSVRAADLVTAAGPQLAQRLQSHRHSGHAVEILPMAADPGFVPMERTVCRERLGLPQDAPLLGYSGSWTESRGTHILLECFAQVRQSRPDALLVLSGHPPAEARAAPGVIALGYLDDALLPVLLNALDVSCTITADTAFGRYSYPAKLCEAMACGIPVVATATAPVRWMLHDDPKFLAKIGSATDLSRRILEHLPAERIDYGALPSWTGVARQLDALLSASSL
ncbi:glycosyltransferase family 4 protein [Pseudoxanthomonas helianthi]|uniref:glycosyltransferase family 4 protein n=1 Tax=Pseudoxanthomonas helianthi TaxID=1453541 RepID=UPI001FCFF166|nr:glycosyltransferase family 4 protein [Pseudoxanthomonas helianthi]